MTTVHNPVLERLADYVEARGRELRAQAPPGAQPLSVIAGQLRVLADERTETELARRSAFWPYPDVEGLALESVTRRWATKHIGPRSAEAVRAVLSALYTDGQAAIVPLPKTRDELICEAQAEGKSLSELGRQFGLSRSRIHGIVSGKGEARNVANRAAAKAKKEPRGPVTLKTDPAVREAVEAMENEGGA